MNFRQLLNSYQAVEEGDFFKLYRLKEGTFVVYDDGEKVSCLEMLNLSELSPVELSVFLNEVKDYDSELNEFSFMKSQKEDVLKYLFDIIHINEQNKYKHAVQPFTGYLLSDGKRCKNQIQQETKVIMWDNMFTWCANGDPTSENLFITFDGEEYEKLLQNEEIGKGYVCLLPQFTNFVMENLWEEDRTIYLKLGNEDPVEVLKLIVYLLNKMIPNSVIFDLTSVQIAIGFKKEDYLLELILTKVSEVQKKLRNDYGQLKVLYELKQHDTYVFVLFHNSKKIVKVLNKELLGMLNLKIIES